MMLVRFEMMSAFELLSHTKPTANKKAMMSRKSAFFARKNSPKTSGVKIKTAPSFAKTLLHKAHKRHSAMKRTLALMMSVFWAEFMAVGFWAGELRAEFVLVCFCKFGIAGFKIALGAFCACEFGVTH